MKICVYDTYEEMAKAAADLIAAQILVKPESHIGMTLGSTPAQVFTELVEKYRRNELSFKQAYIYNLEELIGQPADSPKSCAGAFHSCLTDLVDLPDDHLRLPDGMAENIDEECAKYDQLLDSLPGHGLDIQLLGIGGDAHIGMNTPAESLISATHVATPRADRRYIAMGIQSIMCARKIILIANGESKAEAIAAMCTGKISTQIPASLLQIHPDSIVMVDKAAAKLL